MEDPQVEAVIVSPLPAKVYQTPGPPAVVPQVAEGAPVVVADTLLPEMTWSQLIAIAVTQVSLSGTCPKDKNEKAEAAQNSRIKEVIFFMIFF